AMGEAEEQHGGIAVEAGAGEGRAFMGRELIIAMTEAGYGGGAHHGRIGIETGGADGRHHNQRPQYGAQMGEGVHAQCPSPWAGAAAALPPAGRSMVMVPAFSKVRVTGTASPSATDPVRPMNIR